MRCPPPPLHRGEEAGHMIIIQRGCRKSLFPTMDSRFRGPLTPQSA
jgi:hypothetical protein